MSKGSRQRTFGKQFENNFDAIFRKQKDITPFDAAGAVFECMECDGRMKADIAVSVGEFSVPTLTCQKCGSTVENNEDPEDLLGV